VVVEDSRNGFLAAQAAGMPCVVTTNSYTEDEDFTGADLVVRELGDPPGKCVYIERLQKLSHKQLLRDHHENISGYRRHRSYSSR